MAQLTLDHGLEVLRGRSRVATFVIVAYMALSVMMTLMTLGLVGGQVNFDDPTQMDGLSTFASLAALAYIAVFLLSVIVVSMWIYRGHANLRAAGSDHLEFSPGWSVGWFFVPVANLFKPFQAMRELWTASHGSRDSAGRNAPPELVPWWTCYIIGSGLKNASTRLTDLGSTAYLIDVVGTSALLVSAWFLLRIIRQVTAAQVGVLTTSHIFT
jgi:hypothetical protein